MMVINFVEEFSSSHSKVDEEITHGRVVLDTVDSHHEKPINQNDAQHDTSKSEGMSKTI